MTQYDAAEKQHIRCLRRFTFINTMSRFAGDDLVTTCLRHAALREFKCDDRLSCIRYLVEELGIVMQDPQIFIDVFWYAPYEKQHTATVADYVLEHFDYAGTGVNKVDLGRQLLLRQLEVSARSARVIALLHLLHKHDMLHLDTLRKLLVHFTIGELRLLVETYGFDLRPYEELEPSQRKLALYLAGSMAYVDDVEWFIGYFKFNNLLTFPYHKTLQLTASMFPDTFIRYPCIRKLVMSIEHSSRDCECIGLHGDPDERCPFLACYEVYMEHRDAAVKIIEEATGLPTDVVRHEIMEYL